LVLLCTGNLLVLLCTDNLLVYCVLIISSILVFTKKARNLCEIALGGNPLN
jgi:hypothetical protein